MAGVRFIVVGKRAVEWILSRRKFCGNVIASMRRIRIVKAAIAFCPLFVPGARAIRHRIVSTGLLTDPKDGCHDVGFPRITLCSFRLRFE